MQKYCSQSQEENKIKIMKISRQEMFTSKPPQMGMAM